MIRTILGVIIGYLVMVVIVFCTFTASYLLLGADRTFQPGSYEVTVSLGAKRASTAATLAEGTEVVTTVTLP